jgi:valyl-tRNA synthetase
MRELPKTYDHREVEKRIYKMWEEGGFFIPKIDPAKKPFVISMPPPNVTGELHLGHAITASIEDLMIRYHRMKGDPTLWVPGEDHAGIAVQNVVERELAKEGLSRHNLGREKFVERVWEWVRKYRSVIANQHRRLGASCDWTRERFTLDEGLSRAVREAFVRLYEKGLIYRGEYIINWCPRCATTLADLEVEHEEEEGTLWYVRYPLVNEDWKGPRGEWGSGHWSEGATEFIAVATTRPETILGDTAVAVHPDDERYKALVGRTAILPALGRPIPIIADEAVDMDFGTGAVKVTPAHDPTDYEIGRRHGLPAINVMNDDATMNQEAGPYQGLDRFECRQRILQDLEKEGLILKAEPHTHAPGRCYRCHTLIEPRISIQWFVRSKPLAEKAIAAVREGLIRIIPERFEKIYFDWMENIKDWCISRQLWWGHRIPVWYCDDCGAEMALREDPQTCPRCGSSRIRQEEDVLDTWFSSALWPFSTLGWPDDTEDLRYFYPTTVMETGYDILFFWVARMIMMGLECTGKIPFSIVYLHGLVRDELGRKMSKSLGNVIDPVDLMDQYGTDALRFTLLTSSTPGNDMKLSIQRVEGNRNFANKLWNAARLVLSNLPEGWTPSGIPKDSLSIPERWILSRLQKVVKEVTDLIEAFQFGEGGRTLYDFIWGEYCDWYLEMIKPRLYGSDPQAAEEVREVAVYVLDTVLRLLHPYMPFVTEEIWSYLPQRQAPLIILPWPEFQPQFVDEEIEKKMELFMEAVRAIRNARTEYHVEPGKRIQAIIAAGEKEEFFNGLRKELAFLAHLDEEKLVIKRVVEPKPTGAVTLTAGTVEIYLPLAGMVDIEAEKKRLLKEKARVEEEIARAEALLANEEFLQKAPKEVVEKHRARLEEAKAEKEKIEEILKVLAGE